MGTDHPLPGDLVIREARTDVPGGPLYIITVHPDAEPDGHAYHTLEVAVRRAKQAAQKLGGQLQVWREARGGIKRLKTSD